MSIASRDVLSVVAEEEFDGDVEPRLVDELLPTPGHLVVVAVRDGVVIGQVQGYVHRHLDAEAELYIDNLGITPTVRRQGVASGLLEAILEWGTEVGCDQAWIVTEPDNDAANGLYQSIGADQSSTTMYSFPIGRARGNQHRADRQDP